MRSKLLNPSMLIDVIAGFERLVVLCQRDASLVSRPQIGARFRVSSSLTPATTVIGGSRTMQ